MSRALVALVVALLAGCAHHPRTAASPERSLDRALGDALVERAGEVRACFASSPIGLAPLRVTIDAAGVPTAVMFFDPFTEQTLRSCLETVVKTVRFPAGEAERHASAGVGNTRFRDLPRVDARACALQAQYPMQAQQAGVQGTVLSQVTVSATGAVTGVRVVRKLGFGLDEVAVDALRTKCVFKPALDESGAPQESAIYYTFSFELPQ